MSAGSLSIAADSAAPLAHRFSSAGGEHLLIVPFSRVFDLPKEVAHAFDRGELESHDWLSALSAPSTGDVPLHEVAEPAPQSISLNVSSSCNLGCSYCYASRGSFKGAQSAPMQWDAAREAIDRLLAGANPGAPITIGFLGGEPFVNPRLIHRCVSYSVEQASSRGLDVRFSVTTNATLLRPADLDLMRRQPFAVTVSLDGGQRIQDAQRPLRGGRTGSWQLAVERIRPLLTAPGRARIAARATVTRWDMDLRGRLEALAAVGFEEVGFAPLRASPDQKGALSHEDWGNYLEALIDAAMAEIERARQGLPLRLSNFAIALKQIHRGACSPYPCGAGGGYFSVAADGRWYACHRAIGNPDYELGTSAGLDVERRRRFVSTRHVHAQTDCRTCWARYLCSGGCHQEAGARSAASCDFVRGWLDFCLQTYCEIGARVAAAHRRPNAAIAGGG